MSGLGEVIKADLQLGGAPVVGTPVVAVPVSLLRPRPAFEVTHWDGVGLNGDSAVLHCPVLSYLALRRLVLAEPLLRTAGERVVAVILMGLPHVEIAPIV